MRGCLCVSLSGVPPARSAGGYGGGGGAGAGGCFVGGAKRGG